MCVLVRINLFISLCITPRHVHTNKNYSSISMTFTIHYTHTHTHTHIHNVQSNTQQQFKDDMRYLKQHMIREKEAISDGDTTDGTIVNGGTGTGGSGYGGSKDEDSEGANKGHRQMQVMMGT